jgi:hypothetical protein
MSGKSRRPPAQWEFWLRRYLEKKACAREEICGPIKGMRAKNTLDGIEIPEVSPRRISSRRPLHLAPGQQMNMDMRNRFAGIGAAVDDEAEAIGESKFFCDDAGGHDQVSKDRLIRRDGVANARD